MPIAKAFDGTEHQFPDNTDPSVIDRVMKEYTQQQQQPAQKGLYSRTAEMLGLSSDPFAKLAGYAMEAAPNVPGSAGRFAHDIVQPILHPIETVTSLKNLGLGVMEKLGIKSGSEHEQYADALGKFLVDRYGSIEAVRKTMVTDPVGFAADASMFLSGGGTAAARAPGIVGRVGEAATTAGRTIDPLTATGKGVKALGRGTAEVIGGLGTHTGGKSIRTAFEGGYEGGESARAFQENLRGQVRPEAVVSDARGAIEQMRKERGAEYREAMAAIGGDKTILDFDKIDKALADIAEVKTFHGKIISESTQDIRKKIGNAVQEWKHDDPAIFHTVEGLDALKQKIGDILDGTQYGTTERLIAGKAYDAIRKTIVEQAPEYAKIMKGYEEASDLIRQLETELSLGKKKNIDTALRKLQSVLRNNVHTNYGRRERLAEFLVNAGAPHLMEALAGQALNTWIPRGLAKMVGTEIMAAAAGAFGLGASGAGAAALGVMPFMSPRLMGEAAYYTGRGVRAVEPGARPAGQALFQLGRGTGPLAPGQ